MGTTKTFTELLVWQKAHKLVLSIYKISHDFPKEETFGLTSQIRRAAISIPANIAEWYRRKSKQEKTRFFNISEGSLEEVKYYMMLAEDLSYCHSGELFEHANEVGKLLNSYSKKILTSIS